jgi:hypothetical protein
MRFGGCGKRLIPGRMDGSSQGEKYIQILFLLRLTGNGAIS